MNGWGIFDALSIPVMILCLAVGAIAAFLIFSGAWNEAYAQIDLNTDSSGSAAGTLNDGFGGFTETLRGWLDGWFGLQDGMGELWCHIQGTFLGYENITGCFEE